MVVNAAAGSTESAAIEAALGVLRAGADVRVETTADLDELAHALAGRDGRRVVVLGGDGSVHAVVQALRDAGGSDLAEPLGLIPLGTGNDLARTLGLPLDAASAAAVVLDGRPRRLDLAVDEGGSVVVNAAHVGVGAEAGRRAHAWKPTMGAAAYPLGSIAAGAVETGWRLVVEVDGQTVLDGAEPVLMVGVGNGRTIGGGAPLSPDAEPDDGLLDVVVSAATGPLARAGYAVAMREGEHVERDDVAVHRGRNVRIRAAAEGEEFSVNADGELSGPLAAKEWTVEPLAWAVLVPR